MDIKNGLTPFQRLIRLLSIDKKQIGYLYLYGMFNGLIYLTIPIGIQTIINYLLGGQLSASLVILIIFVIAGVALSGWLQVIQLSLTENLQQSIFTRASFEFAYRIPRLRLDAVYKEYLPELVNRFFDIFSVQKGFSKLLIDFSTATLQIIFGLILLSFYHPFFVVFAIFIVLIVYLIFSISGPKGVATSLNESKAKYEVVHWFEELARTLNTFKLAGNHKLAMENTDALVSDYLDYRKRHFKILLTQFYNIIGFKLLVISGVIILGSYLVLNGQINIGQFVASEIIIILVINSVEKLILNMDTVYDVLTAVEKVGAVTDFEIEDEKGVNLQDGNEGLKVKFANLSFAYPHSDRKILKNINLTIEKGEKVCISGFNGSGKSTLLQLMAGLYQKYEGQISFNDIPLGNLNLTNLRSHIGDSLFEEKLFYGTLHDNITLGKPDISLEKIVEVANVVGLSSFIERSSDGYFTQINPEGKHLSENVIVRIILARSIISDPSLLLLSDSLGGLENEDRKKIMEYLTDKKQKWTLVIVSNSIEVIEKCERVVILNDGNVMEDSPVELVLKKKKLYHNILR